VVVVAFGAAGCGSDSDSTSDNTKSSDTTSSTDTGSDAAGTTVQLGVKKGELKFDKETLEGKAGQFTITFTNDDSIGHNVVIEDSDGNKLGETDIITNDTADLTVTNIKPGTYEFYCAPHRSAGMKGTLTIT
jgi:plastocyanin